VAGVAKVEAVRTVMGGPTGEQGNERGMKKRKEKGE
jgi:hypothetical protein